MDPNDPLPSMISEVIPTLIWLMMGLGVVMLLIALGHLATTLMQGRESRSIGPSIIMVLFSGGMLFASTLLSGQDNESKGTSNEKPTTSTPTPSPSDTPSPTHTPTPTPTPTKEPESWKLPKVENLETLWLIPVAIIALLALYLLVRTISRSVKRSRAEKRQLEASRKAAQQRWATLVTRHDELRQKILHAETDWDTLFTMPALQDVSDPTTSKLYLAVNQAADESAEMPASFKEGSVLEDFAYARAVNRLDLAWQAAWRNAKRIGTSQIPTEEKKLISTIQHTLRLAEDGAASEAERTLAYERVESMLKELKHVTVPRQASLQITQAQRRMIEAAPVS